MAFDFPASPTLDQTYTAHGVTFRWNGYAWVQAGATFAPIASPVFTGDPQAPTPTAGDNDTSLATTAFVTGAVSTSAANKVSKSGDTMSGPLIVGYTGSAWPAYFISNNAGVDPAINQSLAIGGNYTGGSGEIDFVDTNVGYSVCFNFYQMTSATTKNLLMSMLATGEMRIGTDPTVALGVATKQSSEAAATAAASTKVAKGGDTMSGPLVTPKITVGAVPTTGTEPANTLIKTGLAGVADPSNPQYVLFYSIAGNDSFGGILQQYWYNNDGSIGLGIGLRLGGANYEMLRFRKGSAVGAPDGQMDAYVPLNLVGGGTWAFSGPGAGSWYSTSANANRFFVGTDTLDQFRIWASAISADVFSITGATGLIRVYDDPVVPLGIATKRYVDARKANAYVASTAPAGAEDGALWYENDSGLLYIRYNDGSSTQWVAIAARAEAAP